jgi:hypothetical protein
MALTKCKECGNEVSTTAETCPKCGAKVKKRTGCLTWAVAGFMVLVLIGIISNNLDESEKQEVQRQQADVQRKREAAKQKAAMTPEQQAAFEKKEVEERAAQELNSRKLQGTAWNYGNQTDTMTKKDMRFAIVKSLNEFEFDFPYQGAQRATLQLRVHPRYGSDVILAIERGQFHCGIDECDVQIRFGEGKPQTFSAGEPADNSSDTLFIRNYARFLTNLRKVDTVYIEASFFQQGIRVFEFDVRQLDWK